MIFLLIAYLLLSTLGLVFVKLGGGYTNILINKSIFSIQFGTYTVLGLLMYICSFIIWIVIIQKYNLSYIAPIATGLTYVLIIFFSVSILQEKVNLYQWLGIFVVLAGIILMNIKK